jgi:hypothetical protein
LTNSGKVLRDKHNKLRRVNKLAWNKIIANKKTSGISWIRKLGNI